MRKGRNWKPTDSIQTYICVFLFVVGPKHCKMVVEWKVSLNNMDFQFLMDEKKNLQISISTRLLFLTLGSFRWDLGFPSHWNSHDTILLYHLGYWSCPYCPLVLQSQTSNLYIFSSFCIE